MEESRKVYGWLVRDRNAAVGCSSMWTGTRGGENYCGNLLWQSTLLVRGEPYAGKLHVRFDEGAGVPITRGVPLYSTSRVFGVAVKAKPECCSEQNRNGGRGSVERASATYIAS